MEPGAIQNSELTKNSHWLDERRRDQFGNVGVVTPKVSTTLNFKYKFEPSEQTRQATWSDNFCRNVGARIIVVVLCALKRRGCVSVCQASSVKE